MMRIGALALPPLISVEFGVTVSMFALVAAVGTPATQLSALNQPLETAPVQLVWACVETVDAVKSAIVASNVDKTNLHPARARDVAPRRVPMDDSGRSSHPISASINPAMQKINTGPPLPRSSLRRGFCEILDAPNGAAIRPRGGRCDDRVRGNT